MPNNSHLNYRYRIPLFHTYLERINEDGKHFGIQTAMKNAIIKSGSRMAVSGLTPNVLRILKSKKAVIVANHPYALDPIAFIGSLPPRKDLYLLINARFLKLLPGLNSHLIPVYVNHQPTGSRMQRPLDKIVDFFYPYKKYRDEKARGWNRESLKEAAKRVKKGGSVILFTERNGNYWRSGIGQLLLELADTKDVFLVMAHLNGTSHLDYARLIPGLGKFLHQILVTFSNPVKVNKFLDSDPRKIASNLEIRYRNTFH